jgi:hypothetical protein
MMETCKKLKQASTSTKLRVLGYPEKLKIKNCVVVGVLADGKVSPATAKVSSIAKKSLITRQSV